MLDTCPVHSLCTLPTTDGNFRSALERSSDIQIKDAIETMKASGGQHKGRISACERELRRRKRNEKRNG